MSDVSSLAHQVEPEYIIFHESDRREDGSLCVSRNNRGRSGLLRLYLRGIANAGSAGHAS
jgi:hypothetical protein